MTPQEQLFAEMVWAEYSRIRGFKRVTPLAVLKGADQTNIIKAAQLCIEKKYDPVLFVQAQARFCEGAYYTSNLHNKYAAENYTRLLEYGDSSDKDRVHAHFEAQRRLLRSCIYNTKREVEEILMDDLLSFSPWFRILVSSQPIEAVITKYKEAARRQLTPSLREYIKKNKLPLDRITSYG